MLSEIPNTQRGHTIIDTQYLDTEEATAGAEALAEEGLFGGYTRHRTLYIIIAVLDLSIF